MAAFARDAYSIRKHLERKCFGQSGDGIKISNRHELVGQSFRRIGKGTPQLSNSGW
jgi:hypothetical protein